MPKQSIRFGINDGAGNRSATWKCWTPTGTGQNDIYLACRTLGGALKTSLHESGQWHIAYSDSFFEDKVVDPGHKEKGRFLDKWPRPKEIAPGVTLAFRIITPYSAVNTPYNHNNFKHIHWLPNSGQGKATEIDIIIVSATTPVTGWPGKRSMNTRLVDSMRLDSGETVWVVFMEVGIPNFPKRKIAPQYYKGKSREDFKGENMRIQVFGAEDDGSRVIYDCALELGEKNN